MRVCVFYLFMKTKRYKRVRHRCRTRETYFVLYMRLFIIMTILFFISYTFFFFDSIILYLQINRKKNRS